MAYLVKKKKKKKDLSFADNLARHIHVNLVISGFKSKIHKLTVTSQVVTSFFYIQSINLKSINDYNPS